MPAFSVEDVIKANAIPDSAPIDLLSMQQEEQLQRQEKQRRDSSSPFWSPSPYVLNCKRRVQGGKDALSACDFIKEGISKAVEPLRTLGVSTEVHKPADAQQEAQKQGGADVAKAPPDIASASQARKLNPRNNRLSELRDALESFLIDSWSLRDNQQQQQLPVDPQELRTKLLREKILSEILSSKRRGNMKLQTADASTERIEHTEAGRTSPKHEDKECFEEFFSSAGSTTDEFYDAADVSSEGYTSRGDVVSPLENNSRSEPELAHQLETEVKRRLKAEECLRVLQQCQQEIINKLLSAGCSISDQPANVGTSSDHGLASLIDQDWQDDDGQRALVARLISSAAVRGALRGEEAEALKILLSMKDREAARLRQKIRFYEQVNHELSYKNQEAIERARRMRKLKEKWLGISGKCLMAGAVLGVSGSLLYWLFPLEKVRCIKSQAFASLNSVAKEPQAT